jgi:hypothetical protein
MEGVPFLVDTRSFSGQQKCGEEFPFLGLISEADLSPLHGRTQSPFCGVVGGLNAVMLEKGEQNVPVLEQASCRLGHMEVGAGAMELQASTHAAASGFPYTSAAASLWA